MNQVTQYTVYVSDESILLPVPKTDWKEVAVTHSKKIAFILAHSNKIFLSVAVFILFSLTFYMKSTFMNLDQTLLKSAAILTYAIAGSFCLAFSCKGIQYEKNSIEELSSFGELEELVEKSEITASNNEEKNKPTANDYVMSEDEIISELAALEIVVKTTKHLSVLLEKNQLEFFINIRERTILKVYPKKDKVKKQVLRLFDTVQYCHENNVKTIYEGQSLSFKINNREYKKRSKVSGDYVNKIKGNSYKSGNELIDWMSPPLP